MSKAENPPAFPSAMGYTGPMGMSLRDYFAAKVMQSILSSPHLSPNSKSISDVSTDSYKLADAMLAERSKQNG